MSRHGRLVWTVGVSMALWAHPALATVVVVDSFTGMKKKEVRDAVVDALERADHEVVNAAGARVPPSSESKAYTNRASEFRAAAFVDGEVKQQNAGWTLRLTVRNGADGRVLGESTLKGKKLPKLLKQIDAETKERLDPFLERASAPETKETEKAPPSADAAEPPESAEATAQTEQPEAEPEPRERRREPPPQEPGRKPVVLELWGGMQAFSRSFEYHQDVNGSLRPYHLPLWPALEARVGYYPGAHFTRNMAANVGIIAGISRSVGASSDLGSTSKSYGTTMQEIVAGARLRIPIARHEIGASFLYGNHRFEIDSDHDTAGVAANGLAVNRDYVPDASYQYLRPGIDARFAFGPLRFGAGLGYRAVLGLGELASNAWFPHATAQALDGFVFAGYEVSRGLYVTAGFDATRYALDMHATLADRSAARDVAGGAVDQYLTGRLGVEFRLGEPASGSSEWRVSRRTEQAGSN